MTENLLLKIEDKVLLLLAEITNLRQEVKLLREENGLLRSEQGDNVGRMHELLSLLDILEQDKHEARNMEGVSVAV